MHNHGVDFYLLESDDVSPELTNTAKFVQTSGTYYPMGVCLQGTKSF